jgi:hypothetical protein
MTLQVRSAIIIDSFEKFAYLNSLPSKEETESNQDLITPSFMLSDCKSELVIHSCQMWSWLEEHGELDEAMTRRGFIITYDPRIEAGLEKYKLQGH